MTLTQIFAKVLNMSLTASLVIVLVIAARFILRKSPKVFSYALWAVVLFRLLCPVSLPSPVSLLGLLDAPVAESDGITSSVEYVPTNAGGYREIIVQNPVRTEIPDVPVRQQNQQVDVPSPAKSVSVAEIITYVWIAGMAVLFLVGIGSYFRFRRHLTGACQLKGNIYLVDHIDSAFVAGLFSPKIYLPSDLPVKQMRYIIAHEQYHLKRFDHVAKHLAFVALCIHWFNPLVWAAFILSGKDMEMSCDEAVIKKLGEGIRADYSASLLTLAMGHRIIAGSPLAFGEGDTKGRIKNMANWKHPRKWVSILSCIVCLTVLAACAANPEKKAVISKNDGSFDANIVQSAEESRSLDATESLSFSDTFLSTDGSVTFQIAVQNMIKTPSMPVIEVTPHLLTEEDAHNAAIALFGSSAVFYEAEPTLNERFTKQEVIAQINRWSPYTSTEGMKQLFPDGNDVYWEDNAQTMRDYITYLTSKYLDDDAPDYVRPQCQWKFYKSSHYMYGSVDEASYDTSQDNDEISAWIPNKDGYNDVFTVSRRNKDDFKINNISAHATTGGPLLLDDEIYRREKLRDKPTQEQITAAVNKAQNIMDQMQLGTWKAEFTHISNFPRGDVTEYRIHVVALPVFQGVPSLRRPQLGNLKSTEVYASNYYLTEADFEFSADGTLMDFYLYSPLDVKQTVNDNVKVMAMEDIVNRAKEQLSLSDAYEYGAVLDNVGKDFNCTVSITQFEYGLTRTKAPNTDESYYYVPAAMFLGNVEYRYQNTGEIFYFQEDVPLLLLNAVDGTVIPLENE